MHGYGSWGYHHVHAVADGYCRATKARPKSGDDPLRMDFDLRKGVIAVGRVLGPDGKPAKGVYVAAICSGQPVEWLGDRTKDDGSYRIRGLRPSLQHEMYFRKDGYASVVYDISGLADDVKRGEVQVPEARLQRPRTLTGKVVDVDGEPRKSVMVYLLGCNTDRATGLLEKGRKAAAAATPKMIDTYVARRKLKTNRHGNFYFADLPPGNYELQVGGSSGEVIPIQVTKDKDPKPVRCQYDG